MTCVNSVAPLGLAWENVTVSSDGKAAARGIAVGIGSPQQIVALAPSIGDDNTWLFNAEDCISKMNSSCIGRKGGVYNASLSNTFVQTTKAAWNGTLQSSEFDSGSYIFFNDDMHFGSNGASSGFPFFMDQPGQGTQSGLGIGPQSTFLDAAVKHGSAPSKNFGLWVGSRSRDNPADGALWIGGYDTARVAGQFTDFPVLNAGLCVTCVVITNITYITRSGSVSLLSNTSETLQVALEPFTHVLEVPDHIFTNFLHASNGSVGTDPGTQALVTLPVSADLGNLSVTFSNGYSTLIPSQEIFLPPRQYDTSGIYQVTNGTYVVAALANASTTKSYLPSWGIPILTMNYMIMNYDNQTFSLAPALQGAYGGSNGALVEPLCRGIVPVSTTAGEPSPAAATATSSSSASDSSSKSSHANVGAIAGGVVGGVLGFAITVLLALCLFRSRRREYAPRKERESVISNTAPHDSKGQKTSQHIPSSPTEVSEADQKTVNQWLYSQDKFVTVDSQAVRNIPSYTADTDLQEPQHLSSTLNQPFEMPADHRNV